MLLPACVAWVLAIDVQQKSLLLMMLLHVRRTRVARSPWKIVSHPFSTSSVKGNLRGKAWLTQVPCLVRRGLEECNTARSARRASKVNIGPLSCEVSQPRCCDTRSGLMSLGGSWWWSEDMAWESRREVWKSSSGTLKESCVI